MCVCVCVRMVGRVCRAVSVAVLCVHVGRAAIIRSYVHAGGGVGGQGGRERDTRFWWPSIRINPAQVPERAAAVSRLDIADWRAVGR